MKKYFYLMKNSYNEYVQDRTAVFFLIFSATVELLGFLFLYSFLLSKNATVMSKVLIYYLFIAVAGGLINSRFGRELRDSITSERYITVNSLPINPFIFYFCRSIGRNWLIFTILSSIATALLIAINYPVHLIITFLLIAPITTVLAHLLYFIALNVYYYVESFDIWIIYIIFDSINGTLIPFFLFPKTVQAVIQYALPFGYMGGVFATQLSDENVSNIVSSIIILCIWTAVLFYLATHIWHKGNYYFQENG